MPPHHRLSTPPLDGLQAPTAAAAQGEDKRTERWLIDKRAAARVVPAQNTQWARFEVRDGTWPGRRPPARGAPVPSARLAIDDGIRILPRPTPAGRAAPRMKDPPPRAARRLCRAGQPSAANRDDISRRGSGICTLSIALQVRHVQEYPVIIIFD